MANFNIDYLVVAGGGGGTGGVGNGNGTGGGGAGGLITTTTYNGTESAFTAVTAIPYDVVVGSFGAGGTGSSLNNFIEANRGLNGNNSKFDIIEAIGGGGGGAIATNYPSGADGGSGGGGAPYSNSGGFGTTNQGNSGGAGSSNPGSVNRYRGGGGGGASQSGANGDTSGNGGDGISYTSGQNSITGSASSYAGGGGGGVYSTGVAAGTGGLGGGGNGASNTGNGASALANTGSGGGGAAGAANYNGGNGGSGVVILRYATADVASYTVTGAAPTETIDGTDTILSFTTAGTGTITFTPPPPPTPFDGTRATTPVTGFNKTGISEGLKLPSGDNSNQPAGALAEQGMIRNDTEETVDSSASAIAHYNGTNWQYFAATESVDNPLFASQNFNTVLYDGTGVSNPITGVGFQPDLVWIKRRNIAAANHYIVDTVRGNGNNTYKNLTSNTTSAEGTTTSSGITNSTIVDGGFTMQGTGARTNANGSDYVAWCFKAGGAAVPNTNGSITSQVSANVAGGFSIVKYSGGNSSGTTVGHGLSSAPELIITKNTSKSSSWPVFLTGGIAMNSSTFTLEGSSQYLALNSTTNFLSYTFDSQFGGTANSGSSSQNIISYCFHSIPGYSKIGSFVGTGLAGKKITLDFQPAWLMIKRSSTTGSWTVIDNKINTASIKKNYIKIDSNETEVTATTGIVFESDGFSFSGGSFNQSGQTAIYLAFATS
jgi:hypothetical protein